MAQPRRRFPFRKTQPTAQKKNYAFIDSQNLNLGTQRVGWKLDWKKFRQYLREKHNVEKAYMFIGYVPDNEDLYKQMQDSGYLVVLKPTVDMFMSKEELADEAHVTKGNADAELVLYAMKEINNYQKAVIVSGDGDFFCLVEYLGQQQKLDRLLTPNEQYSSLYKTYAEHVTVLNSMKRQLAYEFIKKRNRRPTRNKR